MFLIFHIKNNDYSKLQCSKEKHKDERQCTQRLR